MASIVVSGDTSGSVTLSAPSVAGTTTVTLPSSTGTMALLQTPSFATTIGVGGTTASASGAGISFPATQSASSDANTLDDYEEGTFTPTIQATGYTFTFPSQSGVYTKVGNLVTFKMYFIASVSSGSGTVAGYIAGLPFTASSSNSNFGGCSFFPDGGSTFFTRTGVIRTNPSDSRLTIGDGWGGSGLVVLKNWATLPASTEWEISGHYYI